MVLLFTPHHTHIHSVVPRGGFPYQLRLSGFALSPRRLTGVGRARLGGIGCGKALWDSPGRDPGVGGATSTTSDPGSENGLIWDAA